MHKKVLLSTAVFPPIQYFSKLFLYNEICIEAFENYTKQNYRTRYEIAAANGKMTLSVPVVSGRSANLKITDVRIAYDTDWQRIHFKSIESAYRSTPFYEYYIDDFEPFFNKKYEFLFDYNMQILAKFLELLEIELKISLSIEYISKPTYTDLRNAISPKTDFAFNDELFQSPKYSQVFDDKNEFLSNLSILDLLFNEGPNTYDVIKASVKGESII